MKQPIASVLLQHE